MVDDGQKKNRMQRKSVLAQEKQSIIVHDFEDDINRLSESYVCTGDFKTDFNKLCLKNQMPMIPEVKPRPHRPDSQPPPPPVEEKVKPGKSGKNLPPPPPPEPELEPSLNENEISDPPPKTFSTKDRFEYFQPCIQTEVELFDRQEFVTEVYIRGWKIDVKMMEILGPCWSSLERLQMISLWNAGLSNETLEMLGNVSCTCPALRLLILDNNPVASEAWHLLITENSLVQHLSLRFCGITDLGAENLGRALGTTEKQNQKLLCLNLTGNKIEDKGAKHLADGLRMNRTLLSLCLANNSIGDDGAVQLAEVISRFSLKHDEIIMRRRLLSAKKVTSPLIGKKADNHERPVSVKSQVSAQSGGTKGKPTKTGKKGEGKGGKEDDGKHDKSKSGKSKETEKTPKRGSQGSETSKSKSKIDRVKEPKRKLPPAEAEVPEPIERQNPLFESVEQLEFGVMLIRGNFALISLNLSYNKIGEIGLGAFLKAIRFQMSFYAQEGHKSSAEDIATIAATTTTSGTTAAATTASVTIATATTASATAATAGGKQTKENGRDSIHAKTAQPKNRSHQQTGLLRLCLEHQRNELQVTDDNDDLKVITAIMMMRDPILKIAETFADLK